ncbi:MAG: phosphate/phosphite/phosphonate ABC transporter substrate-binding protein [Rhodocyclaceae bacterium]|nr:phosphate/phosphite/phosphonate ABC transporter substrate-binding protein [Rhodocyclaceae bacterium]MDZ4214946.1 phosphate/phosphite/phosphonate ABC transporter substrate-binding protein [Rhodocyclaceae bacterium]
MSILPSLGTFATLLVCIAAFGPGSIAQAADAYTFGVVPQYEQRKLFVIWKPIVEELSKRSGLTLNLVATLTVPEFERELAKGNFDIVYANPYHILRESSRQGYVPLVRDKEPLRGILVVRKDSPVKNVAELNGQTLAIPSFNAVGASLLIRADLEHLFQVKMTPLNVKTHTSVYLNVATGLVPAGGGVEKTFNEQAQKLQDQLRVLYTTREMPSHPVAAHPRIPAADRSKIQRAFLDLAATEAGRALLAKVPITEAIPTTIKDYLPMRAWGLDAYWGD